MTGLGSRLKLAAMQRLVIINADDFGLCEGVNRAVEEAHKNGILTSATIMANMPFAKEAVELAKRMPSLGVGVHLNLVEGGLISSGQENLLADKDGRFAYKPSMLAVKSLFSKPVRDAIKKELAWQIQWVIDRGIRPTHLDSHKHVHAFWSIFPIVCELAQDFGIKAIRWTFEPAKVGRVGWPRPGWAGKKRAMIVRGMALINKRQNPEFFLNNALLGIAHTGKIDQNFFRAVTLSNVGPVAEVMTHPGYPDGLEPSKTRLIQQRRMELETLCSERTKQYFQKADIGLVHYGQIN